MLIQLISFLAVVVLFTVSIDSRADETIPVSLADGSSVRVPEPFWSGLSASEKEDVKTGLTLVVQYNGDAQATIDSALGKDTSVLEMKNFEDGDLTFRVPRYCLHGNLEKGINTTLKTLSKQDNELGRALVEPVTGKMLSFHRVIVAHRAIRDGSVMGAKVTADIERGGDTHFLTRGEPGELPLDSVQLSRPIPDEVQGLKNISLNSTGNNAAFCLDGDDQCAFMEPKSGITFSSLAPGVEASRPDRIVQKNFEDSRAYCEDLDWAGSTDWRLPSYRELDYLTSYLVAAVGRFISLGGNRPFLWTAGYPNHDNQEGILFDEKKGWIFSPHDKSRRHFGKERTASFRCVRNDGEKLWSDVSTLEGSKELAQCNAPGRECTFKATQFDLRVTAPLTYRLKSLKSEGVYQSEAKSFCEGLTWNGVRGWRLPSYEEGHAIGHSLFLGFNLSRDAVVDLPVGDFWVTPPLKDDRTSVISNSPYQVLEFQGYYCNLETGSCDRKVQTGRLNYGPYDVRPDLPRGKVICVQK